MTTHQHLRSVTDSEWNSLLDTWREQNDAGNGEAFDFEGEAEETIANVIDHPEVILLAERSQQAVIKIAGDHRDRVLMVCDANGPWLCDVTATWRRLTA